MGDEAGAIVNRMSNPDPLAGARRRAFHSSPEPRCPTTELLTSQCGCRAHRGAALPRPANDDPFESAADLESVQYPGSGPGPWFPAQFDGECSSCDGALWAGEDIRADGSGGWEGRCCGE